MRDYLISSNAVIDELTRCIGASDNALHEVMTIIPRCAKAGRYGDVAEFATEAIGYAYERCAYKNMLRMVKSMCVKGVCERGDSNA